MQQILSDLSSAFKGLLQQPESFHHCILHVDSPFYLGVRFALYYTYYNPSKHLKFEQGLFGHVYTKVIRPWLLRILGFFIS